MQNALRLREGIILYKEEQMQGKHLLLLCYYSETENRNLLTDVGIYDNIKVRKPYINYGGIIRERI